MSREENEIALSGMQVRRFLYVFTHAVRVA